MVHYKKCDRCGVMLGSMTTHNGCSECDSISKHDELYHSKFTRCPQCGETQEVEEYYGADDLLCDCEQCGYQYTVRVLVKITYVSPEKIEGSKWTTEE